MRDLLLLNIVLGVALAYAATREYRKDAQACRLLATVAGVALTVSLALLVLQRGST
ncbi:hypothetical protein D3C81_187380 [compost metagenome]